MEFQSLPLVSPGDTDITQQVLIGSADGLSAKRLPLNVSTGLLFDRYEPATPTNLVDSAALLSIDLNGRAFFDDAGVPIQTGRIYNDASGNPAIDTLFRRLIDDTGALAIEWQDRHLNDTTGAPMIDWSNSSSLVLGPCTTGFSGSVCMRTLPTADPANGDGQLWMDPITRVVKVGT